MGKILYKIYVMLGSCQLLMKISKSAVVLVVHFEGEA